MALLSVDEALKILLTATDTLAAQNVPLNQAGGRILARSLHANLTQPPFNASAMDGYALHASDTQTPPACLRVIGEVAAGHSFDGSLNHGEAVRIFTGAPVPSAADTVIMQEMTQKLDDGTVEIRETVAVNKNIRPAGGDFKKGDIILPAGQKMTAAALALAAASGHATVDVVARPKVAILSTGDELVAPGVIPAASQIVASNACGVAEIARQQGADVVDCGIVADDRQAIQRAVEGVIAQKADVLVTSGGVSVGDYDLMAGVLEDMGMTPAFWKVAMRPGKPLMFGEFQEPQPLKVLGLPGNPVSSLVTAYLFLIPLLQKMAGHTVVGHVTTQARLTGALPENGPRRHYIRALVRQDAKGGLAVTPLVNQDSSMLTILTQANCLIVHEVNAQALPAGSLCNILLM